MWLNESSSASSGQSGQGHFGQNDFVFVKWAHYNYKYLYLYYSGGFSDTENDFDQMTK